MTSNITLVCGVKYDECSSGLLLPILEECEWNRWFRATLYLIGLLYCFLGVAIIADIFMGAIEKITSKTRKVYLATAKPGEEPEEFEVNVWSDTVANLTLMALGSSAPEILLSCIEIIGNNFDVGPLGAGTIVGSAAFNLFFIIAICVVAIPDGEVRRIKNVKVFAVTAFFSVLAYLWLLIILIGPSPNQVEVWEAAVTLSFFPILVLIAWLVEKNPCGLPAQPDAQKQIELGAMQPGEGERLMNGKLFFPGGELDRDSLLEFIQEVKKFPGVTDEDAAVLAATKLVQSQNHSRMWYRVGAVRTMAGGRKVVPQMSMKLKQVYTAMNEHPDAPTLGNIPTVSPIQNAIMDFHAASCAVMENVGKFPVMINRSGRLENRVSIRVESIDGSAVVSEDYIKVNEIITFEPNEVEKQVVIEIVDDNQWEPDEEFFLKLSLVRDGHSEKDVQLGRITIMEVTILNDDEPGTLSFQRRGFVVTESVGNVVLEVVRQGGADGEVSVKWKTIDKSAVNGKDYEGGEGVIVFKHTETLRQIVIPIINDFAPEKNENFEVALVQPEGGAKLGSIHRTAITIMNDDNFDGIFSRMMLMTNTNVDKLHVHNETYKEQIKDALNVNGGDLENATTMDYVLHFLTFGWKVLFALVPPSGIMGGWLCFFVALGVIGVVTAIIGDLAGIFGCLVGLKGEVTAITLVALGTSLPDTFASKACAISQTNADNAIGNVTGSNSVNVFLGLGISWLIAAIYHSVNGTKFEVKAGGLGFSVGLFTGLSLVCIGLLMFRRFSRFAGKAELGGPKGFKYFTGAFMCSLWFLYVILSSLKSYDIM